MQMIKWAAEIMDGNLREARKYAEKAYTLKEKDKPSADWCRDMANAHLSFNTTGHGIVKRLIEIAKTKNERPEFMAGMTAVWEEMHSDMIRESAEIKAMLDSYK